MATYQIENRVSGVVLGVYEAETADLALDLMAQHAGYASYRHACQASPAQNGEISVTEIESEDKKAASSDECPRE